MELTHPTGSTPLTEEDMKGLLVETVFDREGLNQIEAENIARAKAYFAVHAKKYRDVGYLLSDECIRDVHRRMFADVWKWAGSYRTHDTTIGIPFEQIPMQVRATLDNYKVRLEHLPDSEDSKDLLAISLHYDLVCIHPFPNGNGRHTRQMADLLLEALGRPRFTWNEAALIRNTSARMKYIKAIEHAQAYETYGDLSELLQFARS